MMWPGTGSSNATPSPALATTKCSPPVPSARSTAVVLHSTRSPGEHEPVRSVYATAAAGSPPVSRRTVMRCAPDSARTTLSTTPQTSRIALLHSAASDRDDEIGEALELNDLELLVRRVDFGHPG